MEKTLYQKTVLLRDRALIYSLCLENEKYIFKGGERKNEMLLFQITADVSGFRLSYMIRFLERLAKTKTPPQLFGELLGENIDFFYTVVCEKYMD